MIYVHSEVPFSLSDIIVPKMGEYISFLEKISGKDSEQITGWGYCSAVSDVLSVALRKRDLNAGVCFGSYFNGFPYSHEWVSVVIGDGEYSIDLTHRQTGSDHMAIFIPSENEHGFNLYRNWRDTWHSDRISPDSKLRLKGYEKELLALFS